MPPCIIPKCVNILCLTALYFINVRYKPYCVLTLVFTNCLQSDIICYIPVIFYLTIAYAFSVLRCKHTLFSKSVVCCFITVLFIPNRFYVLIVYALHYFLRPIIMCHTPILFSLAKSFVPHIEFMSSYYIFSRISPRLRISKELRWAYWLGPVCAYVRTSSVQDTFTNV